MTSCLFWLENEYVLQANLKNKRDLKILAWVRIERLNKFVLCENVWEYLKKCILLQSFKFLDRTESYMHDCMVDSFKG